jgi:type I restriction enzyme S subunit
MLNINEGHLEIIKDILARHVPGLEVRAFGSRVSCRVKKYSDLDLAIITKQPLSLLQLGSLRDAFSESDLPFRVDVVDWAAADKNFQGIIQREYETVQKGNKA